MLTYSDFTLEDVERELEVSTEEADLFPGLQVVGVPDWLPGWLGRGTRLALISEKARSEFIVVPILLAARELSGDQFAIYSGQRLDIEPERGLAGGLAQPRPLLPRQRRQSAGRVRLDLSRSGALVGRRVGEC